jgi:Zn-dependent protease with chaperone function
MFPILEILVAVMVGLLYEPAGMDGARVDFGWILGLQAIGLGLAVVAMYFTARKLRVGARGDATFTHEVSFLVHRLVILGLYGVQVWTFHWPLVVAEMGVDGWVLVDEILILSPYLLHLLASWTLSFRVERVFRFHRWNVVGYVLFQLRQRLLPLLPMLFLMLLRDLVEVLAGRIAAVERLGIWLRYLVSVQWAFTIGSIVLVLMAAPFLFRLLWRMKPLPDGSLRRRLDAFGKRVGFKTRDILLWPTRGNVLNAAIIGITGRFRYVMLTDGLLNSLTEDEIEAVYAHEVGHAKHRHMLILLLFALEFFFLLHILTPLLPEWMQPTENIEWLILLVPCTVIWWGVIFGWISRRLERQADVYGTNATARAHDGTDGSAFISALENLAEESGQTRHLPGLRHFTVQDRTAYLREYVSDPRVRRDHRRSIRTLLTVYLALFALVFGTALATLPEQMLWGRARIAAHDEDIRSAFDLAWRLEAGPMRDDALREARRALARTVRSEADAIAMADRLRAVTDAPAGDRVLNLTIARCLVLAAEMDGQPQRPGRILELVEIAGPLLRHVLDSSGQWENDPAISGEAEGLLGRAHLREADAIAMGGASISRATWLARLDLARAAFDRAENLAPGWSSNAAWAGLAAREGDLDEAVRLYEAIPGIVLTTDQIAKLAVDLRLRAPLTEEDAISLADTARRLAGEGPERVHLRYVTAEVLLEAGERALLAYAVDRNPEALTRVATRLDEAEPILGRLADPWPEDPPVPEAIRGAARRQIEGPYRTLRALMARELARTR